MNDTTLAYIAGGLCIAWGIAHLAATAPIVRGFGSLTRDNRLTLTMAWIGGGFTLVFIGILVLLVTRGGGAAVTGAVVYRTSAGMLLAMAVLMLLTASRTPPIPMKLCPVIQATAAVLLLIAAG